MEVIGLLIKLLGHNDGLYFPIYSITCYVSHDSKVRDKYVLACYGCCALGVFLCNSQKVAVAILTSRRLVTSKEKNILLSYKKSVYPYHCFQKGELYFDLAEAGLADF